MRWQGRRQAGRGRAAVPSPIVHCAVQTWLAEQAALGKTRCAFTSSLCSPAGLAEQAALGRARGHRLGAPAASLGTSYAPPCGTGIAASAVQPARAAFRPAPTAGQGDLGHAGARSCRAKVCRPQAGQHRPGQPSAGRVRAAAALRRGQASLSRAAVSLQCKAGRGHKAASLALGTSRQTPDVRGMHCKNFSARLLEQKARLARRRQGRAQGSAVRPYAGKTPVREGPLPGIARPGTRHALVGR